jgi:oligopeptide transport system substrate-binding protein
VAHPINLEPLTQDQVAGFLRAALGQAHIPTWLADSFHLATGGNPLFLEETLKALAVEGQVAEWMRQEAGQWTALPGRTLQLPQNVLAVAERRLALLAVEDRSILTSAAVVGPEFEFALLQRLTKLDEDTLLDAIDRLLAGHLIEELPLRAGEDRYRFAQEALRQALLKTISRRRRRTLHRRVGAIIEAITDTNVPGNWPALAYHFVQGGVGEKAVTYLLQAGDRARGLYAHHEAIGFYQQALTFLKEQDKYEQAARTQMKLGLTYHNAFDFRQARQAYQEGFALWQRASQVVPAVPPSPAPHALRVTAIQPSSLDPTMAHTVASARIIDQLFGGLVELSPEMEVIPDGARSWEVLEGGYKYIFHLRDDWRWSDGAPVTAEDFEYAWKRVLNPTIASPVAGWLYDVKGARAFHQGKVTDPDQVGVRPLDEVTLKVELEGPTSYFPYLLTHHVTYPVPRHTVKACGADWTEVENIVTNGPFRLVAWQRGHSMVLERNPAYRGRFTGNVQQVQLRLMSFAYMSTQMKLYEANALDTLSLWARPGTEVERFRQQHADDYLSQPLLNTYFIGFDVSRSPFDDPLVRRAFVLAIDREKLADVVLGGYVFPATGGLIPPGMPGHSAGIGLPYDPDQARRLLAEAGYPRGQGFPAVEWFSTRGEVHILQYLQAQWSEALGIDLAVEAMGRDTLFDRLRKAPSHLFYMGSLADYPDPDCFLRASTGLGYTRWRNERYDELVEKARRISDQEERMKLYQQADRILMDKAVIMPYLHEVIHQLVKPWLSRYPISPLKAWFWKDVIIEPH